MTMNQSSTSISDLCCIFCCPPLPSRIVSKLAFLPPQASYEFIKISEQEKLKARELCSSTQEPISVANLNSTDTITTGITSSDYTSKNRIKSENRNSFKKAKKKWDSLTSRRKHNKEIIKVLSRENSQRNSNNQIKTYNIPPEAEYRLKPNSDTIPYDFDPDQIIPSFVKTKRGNKIACTYIKYTANKDLFKRKPSKFVILFSHGNAVDIGQMPPFYIGLAHRLKTDIFSYDYSGYGLSSGTPNEQNLYSDIRAAYNYLKNVYHYQDNQIILYGQSIGTVPTIDIASSNVGADAAATILHSPLLSGIRVIAPNAKKYCFDPFPSIDKMDKIKSKVLVIHGTEDEVIDFNHGLQINELARDKFDPLWVEGAGHNDIEHFPIYMQTLLRLMKQLDTIRKHREEEKKQISKDIESTLTKTKRSVKNVSADEISNMPATACLSD